MTMEKCNAVDIYSAKTLEEAHKNIDATLVDMDYTSLDEFPEYKSIVDSLRSELYESAKGYFDGSIKHHQWWEMSVNSFAKATHEISNTLLQNLVLEVFCTGSSSVK